MTAQVVWFKRDLRVVDHAPLCQALQVETTLPLYIIEPELWAQPDRSMRQWNLLKAYLDDLNAQLRALGSSLCVRVGNALDVLEELHSELGRFALHSHEETGTLWTYRRDQAVQRWCRDRGVEWVETPQFGVVRGLKDRDGWSRHWRSRMQEPMSSLPAQRQWRASSSTAGWQDWQPDLDPDAVDRLPAGRAAAVTRLESFLNGRGERYHLEMSSPVTAHDACSRLREPLINSLRASG